MRRPLTTVTSGEGNSGRVDSARQNILVSYEQLIDHLNYSIYRANRKYHGLTAELAAKYFDNAAALEARYQIERIRKQSREGK